MVTYVRLSLQAYRELRAGRLAGQPLAASVARSRQPNALGLIVPPTPREAHAGECAVVVENVPPLSGTGSRLSLREQPLYMATIRLGATSASGVMQVEGQSLALSRLLLGGSILETIPCQGAAMGESRVWAQEFSRTLGALVGGAESFSRMEALSPISFIGMGRGGSCLVASMVQAYPIGRRGKLFLIDHDIFEAHSLNAHRLLPEALGANKAQAMARLLGQYGAKALALNRPVEEVVDWIKHSQILFSWPDNAQARRLVGLVAAAYSIPLIDVGTRVEPGGAGFVDTRTVIPGSSCWFCLGGAGNETSPPPRGGSLLSVNSLAVGLAMLAFENLMAGLLPGAQWVQVDITRSDSTALTQRRQTRNSPARDCRICQEVVGRGDAAFAKFV